MLVYLLISLLFICMYVSMYVCMYLCIHLSIDLSLSLCEWRSVRIRRAPKSWLRTRSAYRIIVDHSGKEYFHHFHIITSRDRNRNINRQNYANQGREGMAGQGKTILVVARKVVRKVVRNNRVRQITDCLNEISKISEKESKIQMSITASSSIVQK